MVYPIFETNEMVSARIELLKYMLNNKIKDIIKIFPNDISKSTRQQPLFDKLCRGIVIVLCDNSEIGFSDDESTGSLGVFSIKSPNKEYDKSNNYKRLTNLRFSENNFFPSDGQTIIGQKIIDINIIQGTYSNNETLDKIGVILKLDNNVDLYFFIGGKVYLKDYLPLELINEIKFTYNIND